MYMIQRFHFFAFAIYLLFVILALNLFKVQIIDGAHYRRLSENNRIRLIPIRSTRGRILDANKEVLADNVPSFNLQIIPDDFYIEKCSDLAEIIDVPAAEIKSNILKSAQPSFVPVKIKEDLTEKEVHIFEENNLDFAGAFITIASKRYYPYGEVASQLVGYLGKIQKNEYPIKKHTGYLIDDYVGRAGIESIFDAVLHGVHGGKQIEVNARGQEMRVLALKHPFTGDDIHLTIDIKLQEAIHETLGEEQASVCLMNIHTGEILALVSTPGFDPNAFVTPSRSSERLTMLKDKSFPFLNRAISSTYPPGSVFKIVTALAALEAGKINPYTTFECTGEYRLNPHSRAFRCWATHGHGDIALEAALQQSCNVYFYKIGQLLGADAIADFAKKIGLSRPFSLELPNVKQGIVPSTAWKREKLREKWYQGETLNYSIGQGFLTVTPMQVLRLIGVIAANGHTIEPTIIKGVRNKTESILIKPAHIASVKNGMLKAVDTKYGTANVAKVDFFKVAGKTGTAQNTGEPHSWFAGFFPYKNPQMALVVVVEHGGSGGGKAATIANTVVTLWHERYSDVK
jgi:penicillin-binding protein 2